ncbi:twin transmembrane helix small protein [Candidatus Odyssella thessalonicensis]|uniref:twin transmembrane helix small protein n=1 Tax=Candidatus Odyssella thessalonicensis TaxID=84647 RepID=UPI000225B461|nr:twin transmembrane helix small protein [Candidatus Odyssella thessalonicensis]
MNNILTTLLIITLIAIVGVLGFGLYTLLRGGEFSQKHSNTAMRWRVLLQGVALLIFALILWAGR